MTQPRTTQLSVNLNKVALLRASRGRDLPNLLEAAEIAIAAGCHGLTVHPRVGAPHITLEDVRDLAGLEAVRSGRIELNVEGEGRDELLELVAELQPAQFTLVPADPGERTTSRGWSRANDATVLARVRAALGKKTRLSLFIDPEPDCVELAHESGADAIEIHTFAYAEHFGTPRGDQLLEAMVPIVELARSYGLRVHAGHDLNLENLPAVIAKLHPEEVSIGHALLAEALLFGLPVMVERYRRSAES